MNIGKKARALILVMALTGAIGSSAAAVRFAGAEPVHQTGPSGEQCNLKGPDTDFSGADNNYQTNDAVDAFGDAGQPALHIAGCDLVAPPLNPPTPTPPTPTPSPTLRGPRGALPSGVKASS